MLGILVMGVLRRDECTRGKIDDLVEGYSFWKLLVLYVYIT